MFDRLAFYRAIEVIDGFELLGTLHVALNHTLALHLRTGANDAGRVLLAAATVIFDFATGGCCSLK